MAFSNITTPSEIVFSGNPVIFSGESSIRSQQFATIAAKFVCYKSGAAFYTEEYTYPLSDDGKFQFDLSSALCEAFRQMSAAVGQPDEDQPSVLTYTLTLTEEYFSDGVRMTAATIRKGVGTNEPTFYAIPGADAEYERYFGDAIEDTKSALGSGRMLTRKPNDAELVVVGCKHLLPYVKVDRNGTPSLGYVGSTPSHAGKQQVRVSGLSGTRSIYAEPCDEHFLHLVFRNSFGMLETVTAVATGDTQVPISTSQYDVQPVRTFRSISIPNSRTSLSAATLSMSSGIVTRAWRDWWLSDVLTTKGAWVLVGDRYIPCAVVPEKTYKHEESDGDAYTVDFSVKLGIKGVTL